jgi:hypothetical protein
MYTVYIKKEQMEHGNFHFFAANGKQKYQTSVCLLHIEMENGNLFSLVGKQ